MHKPLRIALAASVALAVAACGVGSDAWTGTITDSAGVTVVQNPNQGTWSPSSAWRLEEELRIGETEGSPEYQFGQVGTIGVGSDGSMYVIDAQAQQVRVFSPDGEFLRSFGRPGAGPGEIGAGAAFVLVGAGDTVLVPDLANRRINRYAADGTPLGSVPIEIEKGLPMAFRATPAGQILVQIRSLSLPDRPAPDTLDRIVRLTSAGEVADTLLEFPSGGTLNLGGGTPEINLYAPEPAWDVTDDLHVVYGVNDVYRIGVYGANRELQREIKKPFERQPVSENDREAIMSALTRAWTDAGVPPALLPQLRSFVHFGEFIPAFASLQVGPRGSLWVQHLQTAAGMTPEELEQFNPQNDLGAPDWDVFDAEGRYLGVVSMPPRFQPRLFKGDRIYGVWLNDLDVQFVTRLKVVGIPGAEG